MNRIHTEKDSLVEEFKLWLEKNLPNLDERIKFIAVDTKSPHLQQYFDEPIWDSYDNFWAAETFCSYISNLTIPEKFSNLEIYFSIEELNMLQNSTKQKTNSKFAFVREVYTPSEILVALAEGLYLSNDPNLEYGYYLDGDEIKEIYSRDTYDLKAICSEKLSNEPIKTYQKIEQKWYHSIPKQGILCWVDDYDAKVKNYLKVVTEYEECEAFPFSNFKFATPLTLEEAKEYILECQNVQD